jgi:hypothetical protein
MNEEPADNLWPSFRISKWTPELALKEAAGERPPVPPAPLVVLEAEAYGARRPGAGANWELIPDLGHTGAGSIAVFPTTAASYTEDRLAKDAPRVDYPLTVDAAGTYRLDVQLLPTHALAGDALRFAIGLDGGTPRVVTMPVKDGTAEWAQGVLNAKRIASSELQVERAGKHVLNLYAVDPGVVVDSLSLNKP